jgi:hypothetical protein
MSFFSAIRPSEIERPVLDLSGDILRAALQAMTVGSEAHGGIERYVDAVKLKSVMFGQVLVDRDVAELDLETFKGLCTFMATVRRRIGFWLNDESFEVIRGGLVELFDDADPVDKRIDDFCGRFPMDKQHRWVRDLATETLHNTDPERFPLMNRWVWDATANTGVIREIWHGDDVDNLKIPVGDGYGTYLTLREELSQFLTDNGFFRDIIYYVDILCAQVYAQYICEQGGSYLRTDFSAPEDPMQHTRRLLGLDGVRPGTGRTRLKSVDGEAFVIEDSKLLQQAES